MVVPVKPVSGPCQWISCGLGVSVGFEQPTQARIVAKRIEAMRISVVIGLASSWKVLEVGSKAGPAGELPGRAYQLPDAKLRGVGFVVARLGKLAPRLGEFTA